MSSNPTTVLETVINTNELLCQILLHLPLRDLLLAQRVTRRWRDLISTSPSLQSALYLRSLPVGTRHALPIHNPLLASVFPPWFIDLRTLEPSSRWPFYKTFPHLPWAKHPDAFRRADASWRHMLVVQPPATTFVVEMRIQHGDADYGTRWVYRLGDRGLRLGLFYDFVEEWCSRVHERVGGVRWEIFANSEESRREAVNTEWDDCVTLILHRPEKPFLQSYGDGLYSDVNYEKPKDFEQFRSLGAVDLRKLEYESEDEIFVAH